MASDAAGTASGRDEVPWRPERLVAAGVRDPAGLRYVVLEEVVGDVVVLQAWPWPSVDARGRLVWPSGAAPLEVSVTRRQLRQQVYRGRLQRDPRPGDTFGAVVAPDAADGPVPDLRALFPEGLYDLSAEGSRAAKLAYQGALAALGPPQDARDADRSLARGRAAHLQVAPPERR